VLSAASEAQTVTAAGMVLANLRAAGAGFSHSMRMSRGDALHEEGRLGNYV